MATVDTLILTIKADRYYSLKDVTEDNKTVQKYTLNAGFDIQLAEYTSTKDVKIGTIDYVFSIQDLSFKKKMYDAGEINAVIHVGPKQGNNWVKLNKSVLEKLLKKKEVTLSWGTISDDKTITAGTTICSGYYVHELSPRYMSDGMDLTLKIYSPDKVMTIGKHCNSWVSAQLGAGVFANQIANFKKPYLKNDAAETLAITDDTNLQREAIAGDIANLKHLKDSNGREAIIPYLVQYNESFWDFLVRSTNRWGEFVYYEDGKLHIGFAKNPNPKSVKIVGSTTKGDYSYNSITYCDLNESPVADEDAGEVCDGVSYDAHMDRSFLEMGKYASVKNGIYNTWEDGLDIWGVKTIGKVLCSGKNLFDFLVDMMVDDSIAWGQATKIAKEANKEFDGKYFKAFTDNTTDVEKAHYTEDPASAETESSSESGSNSGSGSGSGSGNNSNPNGETTSTKKYFYNEFGAVVDNANLTSDTSMANYMPFAASVLKYVPDITPAIYKAVRQCEETAAQNAVCIDFDTNFADLKLGQIITIDDNGIKYVVTQVSAKTVTGTRKDAYGNEVTGKYKVFEVYAIAETSPNTQNSPIFYPMPSPAGHLRFSAPQLAVVCDADDPTRQGRVKVRYEWQKANKANGKVPKVKSDGTFEDGDTVAGCTPWLVYAQPGGKKGTGSFYRHYVGELVLVDFADGNVERPYVVGALYTADQTVPASTYTNNIVHVTPGGQAIKMSDGYGSGLTAFFADMMPSWKMVHDFYPEFTIKDFDKNESFEGSIEIGDKYGIYSIKGSTNGRNITISSPFGDVKLNAFTGITISAPNGDVKIQGKNVSIEAGNNLTITSGKNIKDKWYASYMNGDNPLVNIGLSAGAALTKKLASMAGGFIDFSVLRHTLEIFVKPIEGKMTVKSNRYLSLEAGKGKTGYPTDTYKQDMSHWKLPKFSNGSDQGTLNNTIKSDFQTINGLVNSVFGATKVIYLAGQNFKTGLERVINTNTDHADGGDKLPCNEADAIINALWTNPEADITNTIGFKEMLANDITKDNITDKQTDFHIANGVDLADNATDAQKKEAAVDKISDERNAIIEKVTNIAAVIKFLKENTILQEPTYQQLSETGKGALTGNLTDGSALKTIFNNDDNAKHFVTVADNLFTDDDKKAVRRKLFIALVDGYKFERVKSGLVAKIPEAPDPYTAGIDRKWNDYVNSIQAMPKPSNYDLKSFVDSNLLDPLYNQVSIPGMVCNFRDNLAFGSEKNGQILFSSGADTMVLDKEIMRANTDGAEEDVDKAKEIRNFMNA